MSTVIVNNTIQLNELLPIVIESAYTGMFVTPAEDLNFVDGKTFKFKQMKVGGYQPSTYTSGARKTYAVADVTMAEQTFELSFFREFEHNVFIRDIIYSGGTYNVDEIVRTFMLTQDVPETDAYFFSKVADYAKDADLAVYDLIASIDKENALDKVDELTKLGKNRTFISEGSSLMFVSSDIMDILARTDLLYRYVNVATITEGHSITTRIVRYNGLPIIEVTDASRFWDAYDFTDGFVKEDDANAINMVLVSPRTTKTVIAFNWLNVLAPGQHAHGASYLTQMEKWMDVFCFNNGLDNELDTIAVSISGTEY